MTTQENIQQIREALPVLVDNVFRKHSGNDFVDDPDMNHLAELVWEQEGVHDHVESLFACLLNECREEVKGLAREHFDQRKADQRDEEERAYMKMDVTRGIL